MSLRTLNDNNSDNDTAKNAHYNAKNDESVVLYVLEMQRETANTTRLSKLQTNGQERGQNRRKFVKNNELPNKKLKHRYVDADMLTIARLVFSECLNGENYTTKKKLFGVIHFLPDTTTDKESDKIQRTYR